MKKRILSILLASAMVMSLAAGCGAKGGNEGSSKNDENSITVLVESGSPAEALANETAADFEKETGCKVIVDAVAYTGMYDKLSTEIKAGEATHDVGCLDVVWLAAFKDALEPMSGGSAGTGATTGPWYECVMKNSKNKDMALKYVQYMYEHNGDYMNLTLKIAGRTSVYETAGSEAGNEHTTAVLETLNAAQSQARPMVTTWPQIEEVLTGVVESSLGGGDVKSALESAAAEIETIGQ